MSDCESARLLLHGLLDGELDAANAARAEDHLAACPGCGVAFAEMKALRGRIGAARLLETAPPGLRARIEQSLAAGARRPLLGRLRSAWPIWSLGGSAAALIASLALLLMVPRGPDLPAELVASHVRSLQAAHLVDVATSDQHQVKPWFAGRVDFSPPVIDTSAAGFTLAGGRLDYVGGRAVAAIVYRRRLHVINLFVWPDGGSDGGSDAPRDGYNVRRWRSHGMAHWAVSDLNPAELAQFEALIEAGEAGSRR
ncbi:MAG: anti-sigma factor [Sphingomonadaceae bacterium]|nr:anti-sigma factor [Sphingomonadaceae bacterium]